MAIDVKRRKFIKAGMVTILSGSAIAYYKDHLNDAETNVLQNVNIADNYPARKHIKSKSTSNIVPRKVSGQESAVRDNLLKIENFDANFADDIFLPEEKRLLFNTTLNRVLLAQKVIGYANFNLLGFDEMLHYARRFPLIGAFQKEEIQLIEELFFYDAHQYGFYGEKVITDLTANINKKDTLKIPGSGHYVFQGEALAKFEQLKKDVGDELILTSGVRSIVKQLQLFLAKLSNSNGNLSLASRSLAPPGHSYHGIGDFDVGKKGFGKLNFTSQFSTTKEYEKLIELNYVDLRYTKNNQVGVRYEPWHIKVV